MIILIWAVVGLLSSLCCIGITGFHMGRSSWQSLEYCLIGCLGGIIGAVLVQDIIIYLSVTFGALEHLLGFYVDGLLSGILVFLSTSSLFMRFLRPATRKHIVLDSLWITLLLSIVLACIMLVTIYLRAPLLYIYVILSAQHLTNLNADVLLINLLAPVVGGWSAMLLIVLTYMLSISNIALGPIPASSLLLGLPHIFALRWKGPGFAPYLSLGDHAGTITAIAWSPDSKRLISTSSNHVCISDAKTGATLYSYDPLPTSTAIAWLPRGIQLISINQPTYILGINNASFTPMLMPYKAPLVDSSAALLWSPNARFFALVVNKSIVKIYRVDDGQEVLSYDEHGDAVCALAWSSDGLSLASGGVDKTVRIWNAISGTTLFVYRGHTDTVCALAWSPDSTLLASSGLDGTLRTWQVKAGKDERLYGGDIGTISILAWSPNGKQFASGGVDKTARVWETATGKLKYLHTGHTDMVTSILWSPNGNLIATGSKDTSLHIWRAPGH